MPFKYVLFHCANRSEKWTASSYSGISEPHSASQQIHNKISRADILALSAVYYVSLSLFFLSLSHSLTTHA